MSFLAPLYALGALAIAAPILLHLIRRTPRGELPFSSLMFLAPSPPRLTRRSRLEHLGLLLLRALALALLAAAFMRPFLRKPVMLDLSEADQRRVLILVDTSASMRRGDAWERARAQATAVIDASRPGDQLALVGFDAVTRPLLGFDESLTLDPVNRRAVAKGRLNELSPGWNTTNLGQALVDAVAAIQDVGDASEKAGRMPRRVILISDFPQGARLDALGNYEWPSDVGLEVKSIALAGSNAGAQWLPEPLEGANVGESSDLRVRVSNDATSRQEAFTLRWVDDRDQPVGDAVEAYVPPGESRVVRVSRPGGAPPARRLRLTGDTFTFDNILYLASQPRDEAVVVYLGDDAADDPTGLRYFLERVYQDTPRRAVKLVAQPIAQARWDAERSVPLIVLSGAAPAELTDRLKDYMNKGGTLLQIISTPAAGVSFAGLAGVEPIDVVEAAPKGDMMLGEIAFDHPLFAPFASAQFNDFTKIHFWKYRRIDPKSLKAGRIVARFENGDPAIYERSVGKGWFVAFTSGWNPADSQLARSSKFVPLMTALLDRHDPRPFDAPSHVVGDAIPLPPPDDPAKGWTVRKPDGATAATRPGAATFSEADQPGVYTLETPAGARSFAVNLDPSESKTGPLAVETLEQYGCRMASDDRDASEREHQRQLQNAELESRQKLWRWLILATIGVLIVETWLAARLSRSRPTREALST